MAETKVVKARIDSVDSTTIEDDSILNADINSAAAILDSKLATITTAGKVNFSAFTVASEAQGDIIYRNSSAWVRLAAGTSGEFLKTQGTGANPIWDTAGGAGLTVVVGTTTRDMTLASGTQTVSGLGMTPKAVIVFAARATGIGQASFGFSDSTTDQSQLDDSQSTADEWAHDTTNAIAVDQGGTGSYRGNLGNFVSGAFDIVWTKTSSPVGSMRIDFLAIG